MGIQVAGLVGNYVYQIGYCGGSERHTQAGVKKATAKNPNINYFRPENQSKNRFR